MDEGLQDHCALVLTDTINFVENYLEITKIISIFAAMLLTNIPKIMTTVCINPHLPVPTTVSWIHAQITTYLLPCDVNVK